MQARFFVPVLFSVLVAACSSSAPPSGGDDTTPTDGTDPTPAKQQGESEESKERAKDPSTALVIGIDAEDFRSQGFSLGSVDVEVKVDGLVAAKETLGSGTAMFPHELKLNAPKDKPEALVEIEVVARDRPDESMPPIVTRRASTHFVKGATKLAYVFLEVRCNTFAQLGNGSTPPGPTCAAPTTCVAARCVPSALPPLDDYHADWTTNPPSACGSGTPEITAVGQSETTFDPLPDGATVTLEQGGQCGHHVWLALRMKNLAQSGTITTISATQPGSTLSLPATAYPYSWGPSEGGACDLLGIRFQVDSGGAKPADLLGKPLDVKFDLKDKAGHTATAVRHLNVAPAIKVFAGRDCGAGPSG